MFSVVTFIIILDWWTFRIEFLQKNSQWYKNYQQPNRNTMRFQRLCLCLYFSIVYRLGFGETSCPTNSIKILSSVIIVVIQGYLGMQFAILCKSLGIKVYYRFQNHFRR